MLRRFSCLPVGNELDAHHRSTSPDIADQRTGLLPFAGVRLNTCANRFAAMQEIPRLEQIQDCMSRGAREWIAAVGTAKAAFARSVHQVRATNHGGEWHTGR